MSDGLDFVFVPGDNADNGRPEQYALARRLLAPLPVPCHVITGDHDMEGGSLDAFYADMGAERLPRAVDVAGVRCLFLDICGSGGGPDFRRVAGARHPRHPARTQPQRSPVVTLTLSETRRA